ncbi:MAG: Rne/Rng family ribonuclease [Actinomycetales bacterium]|nr:Rne/Rng family ribonuclease [Actinomycetales bacterium]
MVDDNTGSPEAPARRRSARRPAGPPAEPAAADAGASDAPAKATRKRAAKAAAPKPDAPTSDTSTSDASTSDTSTSDTSVRDAGSSAGSSDDASGRPAARTTARKTARKAARPTAEPSTPEEPEAQDGQDGQRTTRARKGPITPAFVAPVFIAPPEAAPADEPAATGEPAGRRRRARPAGVQGTEASGDAAGEAGHEGDEADAPAAGSDEDEEGGRRRRRRRGGRRRRRGDEADGAQDAADEGGDDAADEDGDDGEGGEAGSRRRRRRRRRGADDLEPLPDDPANTVVKVRQPRTKGTDDSSALKGSTRLEAKKQRRREGREAGRRRAPILTEAEFLARRESVTRVMAVRQQGDRTQIAVLEDGVLVEHYVTRGGSSSMVGNVYLGRVQNVLPSMEAAFVDIGRGRNAVLYAGEVNWDAAGLEGQPKRIELALKSGDPVLVQVTKDPVGQKGARLTSQVSLPGRFLVYVPDGSMTGISRKLPDTERSRLKSILKRVMPEEAGVIVRTAAEGAPEEALEQDVHRLRAQWEDISARASSASPPTLLSSEPDLAIKVVRDIFNEDVTRLVVSGSAAWAAVESYVTSVAPDLADRLEHWVAPEDLFAAYRVDEQLAKALDRKVWLPSGGSLVIDRTEAMTVVDVNTGKFTGQGGNLEQTVTRNNLEAAEEIVRQLRLRDIGGIIVVDFIDMVLESNRDLVLRRLVECLGRDRTKHQVAEVTSLGLVQMTRKRIGSGLLESFSVPCEHCAGRGIKVSMTPVDHEHPESPRYRRPANAVDPADVAARALAAADGLARDASTGQDQLIAGLESASGDIAEQDDLMDGPGDRAETGGGAGLAFDLENLDADGLADDEDEADEVDEVDEVDDDEPFDLEAPLDDEDGDDLEAPLDDEAADPEAPLELPWGLRPEPGDQGAV